MTSISSHKELGGLITNTNPWTETTKMAIADNVVLNQRKTIKPRKGFDYYINPTSASALAFMEFQSKLLWHQTDNTLWYSPSAGNQTQYTGSYTNVTNATMRGVESSGNFLFTTNNGIYKLTDVTSTPSKAGMPPALDLQLAESGTGGGWASGSTQVAYRITWRRTDDNNNTIRSVPCPRESITIDNKVSVTSITRAGATATVTVVSHTYTTGDTITISGAAETEYNGSFTITVTGATTFTYTVTGTPASPATGTIIAQKYVNVALTFTVPTEIVAGDIYEIWRTASSSDVTISAGDTMFLVYSTEYTAGTTVSYTDTTIDDNLTTTPLYTNANNEGIEQANYPPPESADIELFRGYTWYANTSQPPELELTFISATGGLVDDTSWIEFRNSNASWTERYTFSTAEDGATKKFKRYTTGTASENIINTMKSLIKIINRNSTRLQAEYASGETDSPGIVRIWTRDISTGIFYAIADAGTTGDNFTPILPTSGNTVGADDIQVSNRIYYSKFNSPETVPLLNYEDIGARNSQILRIQALTNSLLVMKEDGIYYITGDNAPWTVRELDRSAICAAPDSCAKMNNKVYMLANQGIVAASESGVRIISLDIEESVNALLKQTNLNVPFGISYEADRQYILWIPNESGDTYAKTALVYNIVTDSWTKWQKNAYTGTVLLADNTLYISSAQDTAILQQRNGLTSSDYSDEEIDITIDVVNGDGTLDITYTYGSTVPLDDGFSLHQVNSFAKIITVTSNGANSYTIELDRDQTWTVAAASVRIPIYVHVRRHPDPCSEAGVSKTFMDYTWVFNSATVSRVTLEVASNENGLMAETEADLPVPNGFGLSAWGTSSWGDDYGVQSIPVRENVPVGYQTGEAITIGLKHHVSQEDFTLVYTSVSYANQTDITTAEIQSARIV